MCYVSDIIPILKGLRLFVREMEKYFKALISNEEEKTKMIVEVNEKQEEDDKEDKKSGSSFKTFAL